LLGPDPEELSDGEQIDTAICLKAGFGDWIGEHSNARRIVGMAHVFFLLTFYQDLNSCWFSNIVGIRWIVAVLASYAQKSTLFMRKISL